MGRQADRIKGAGLVERELAHPGGGDQRVGLVVVGFEAQPRWLAAEALAALGSAPAVGSGPIDDHASDALLTAAWLRRSAHDPALWRPEGLSTVAQTEGWTFGAR